MSQFRPDAKTWITGLVLTVLGETYKSEERVSVQDRLRLLDHLKDRSKLYEAVADDEDKKVFSLVVERIANDSCTINHLLWRHFPVHPSIFGDDESIDTLMNAARTLYSRQSFGSIEEARDSALNSINWSYADESRRLCDGENASLSIREKMGILCSLGVYENAKDRPSTASIAMFRLVLNKYISEGLTRWYSPNHGIIDIRSGDHEGMLPCIFEMVPIDPDPFYITEIRELQQLVLGVIRSDLITMEVKEIYP